MTEALRKTAPESGKMLIRLAGRRDIPEIAALEKHCFSDAWSETSVAGTLDSKTGYVLVAEQPDGEGNDLPLGYLIAQTVCGEGELLRIASAPRARRKGVGRALLLRMLEDHPDVSVWRLDVRTQNAAAIGLYEQNGFRIAAEKRGMYKEPDDNGYLMVKELC